MVFLISLVLNGSTDLPGLISIQSVALAHDFVNLKTDPLPAM
jgi:hypothetical protein